MKTRILGAILLAGLASVAQANPVEVSLSSFEVIEVETDDGIAKKYIPADNILPNDRVLIKALIANTSENAVEDIVIDFPIDPSLVIDVDGIAKNENMATFSTIQSPDTFDTFEELVVETDNGVRPARAEDLAKLRLTVGALPSGTDGSFEYEAIVR